MKFAIVSRKASFSERWISYCNEKGIEYKLVNPYNSDIISQVDDCDAFLWHHSHINYKDTLFAKQLLYSIQLNGKRVFPDFNTGWHFDDKVGQKYLLESVGAPMVPSYVFYSRKEAVDWLKTTSFPKVFKLRGGAGSANVKLARSYKEASRYVKKAFGKGFPQYNRWGILIDSWRKYCKGKLPMMALAKAFIRIFVPTSFSKMLGREKGYAYFQDFIPNNHFDMRIFVVDGKAVGIKRLCRENDFRASGANMLIYDKKQLDDRCAKIALDINDRLHCQCAAYDFVFDVDNNPLIVEISYGTTIDGYDKCEGYWDRNLVWHDGKDFDICGWMIEALMK